LLPRSFGLLWLLNTSASGQHPDISNSDQLFRDVPIPDSCSAAKFDRTKNKGAESKAFGPEVKMGMKMTTQHTLGGGTKRHLVAFYRQVKIA
jgi:hypothetical protein